MGEPSSSEKGPLALLRGSVAYFKLREWSLVFTVADNSNNAKRERKKGVRFSPVFTGLWMRKVKGNCVCIRANKERARERFSTSPTWIRTHAQTPRYR